SHGAPWRRRGRCIAPPTPSWGARWIKLLPEIFAGDPDRVARFEREPKLLGALNHSKIRAIYLKRSSDAPFLVLELVEGETLAEHIARGPRIASLSQMVRATGFSLRWSGSKINPRASRAVTPRSGKSP